MFIYLHKLERYTGMERNLLPPPIKATRAWWSSAMLLLLIIIIISLGLFSLRPINPTYTLTDSQLTLRLHGWWGGLRWTQNFNKQRVQSRRVQDSAQISRHSPSLLPSKCLSFSDALHSRRRQPTLAKKAPI